MILSLLDGYMTWFYIMRVCCLLACAHPSPTADDTGYCLWVWPVNVIWLLWLFQSILISNWWTSIACSSRLSHTYTRFFPLALNSNWIEPRQELVTKHLLIPHTKFAASLTSWKHTMTRVLLKTWCLFRAVSKSISCGAIPLKSPLVSDRVRSDESRLLHVITSLLP